MFKRKSHWYGGVKIYVDKPDRLRLITELPPISTLSTTTTSVKSSTYIPLMTSRLTTVRNKTLHTFMTSQSKQGRLFYFCSQRSSMRIYSQFYAGEALQVKGSGTFLLCKIMRNAFILLITVNENWNYAILYKYEYCCSGAIFSF